MNGSRLVTVLFLSLVNYHSFGRSCCRTIYGVADLVVSAASLLKLLGRPFSAEAFLLCLVVTVTTAFHSLFFLHFNTGPPLAFCRGGGFLLFHIGFPVVCSFPSLIPVVARQFAASCGSIRGKTLLRSAR